MSKEKTPKQIKRQYTNISRACFAGEFLAIMAPFIGVGLANYQEYFIEYDGTRMSLACALAFITMGVAVWLVSKKKFENSFVALIIGWVVVDGILFLLGRIINDLAYIMLFGLIGLLGAYGLDLGSKAAKAKADKYSDAMELAEKELIAEAHKVSIEAEKERKIKVRIKK